VNALGDITANLEGGIRKHALLPHLLRLVGKVLQDSIREGHLGACYVPDRFIFIPE